MNYEVGFPVAIPNSSYSRIIRAIPKGFQTAQIPSGYVKIAIENGHL
jgi:hypothetical protein